MVHISKYLIQKIKSLLQKWALHFHSSNLKAAKDNASYIHTVKFLSCTSCYKELSDNKLTNCYKKSSDIAPVCIYSGWQWGTAERESKILVWGPCLISIDSLCLVIHQTKDFPQSCANPLSYCFWAGSSSCLLPLCPEEAMAFASKSLCV